MNVTDRAVENISQAKTFDKNSGRSPAPKLVIVTGMDPSLTGILEMLGLQAGEADVIRNAGSVINEDTVRSLLVSTQVLGTKEIMIINHTDCGMMTFTDSGLEQKLQKATGEAPVAPALFLFVQQPRREHARADSKSQNASMDSKGHSSPRFCL